MYDAIQIVGSLLILAAFAGALLGRLNQSSYRYLIANAVGSTILTATAVISVAWGFILLEGAWHSCRCTRSCVMRWDDSRPRGALSLTAASVSVSAG
jgi:hypothetical protein